MATLKLQTLTCPSCTRQISKYRPFETTVVCPSCGTLIKNPMVDSKDVPTPERIIPFTSNEETFERTMVNSLVNQNYCDKNVFDGINTDNVFKAYLPMYLFEGTFNSSWSCESSFEDQQVDISNNWTDSGKTISTKKVKKWRPQNGTATGNFAFLCLANEDSKDLPEELRKFTYLFPYDVMCSKAFDPTLLEDKGNLVTIPQNADATIVWQKHGKDMVDQTAQEAALNQIGNQEIRNFRASSSYSLTTKGTYVLAPFWFVYYNYKNQQYHFLMDGLGQRTSYSYPVDQEDVDFYNQKEKVKKIVGWLWVLTLVMWYLFNFTTAFVTLIVWIVAKIVVNKKMNKEIEEMLQAGRDQRQAGASRL